MYALCITTMSISKQNDTTKKQLHFLTHAKSNYPLQLSLVFPFKSHFYALDNNQDLHNHLANKL